MDTVNEEKPHHTNIFPNGYWQLKSNLTPRKRDRPLVDGKRSSAVNNNLM